MMVRTFDNLTDENGFVIGDRTILFIRNGDLDDEGNIKTFIAGTSNIVNEPGQQFIVEEYVINQIDKLKIEGGQLVERKGETVQERIQSPEEIRLEEMEREMAALKQKTLKTEVTAEK